MANPLTTRRGFWKFAILIDAIWAAGYLGGAATWMYVVAAHADDYGGSPGRIWIVVAALPLGVLIGRWYALLVPCLLPLLAVGAGNGTNPDSDIPIAGEMLFIVMPAALLATAAGVFVWKLSARMKDRLPARISDRV